MSYISLMHNNWVLVVYISILFIYIYHNPCSRNKELQGMSFCLQSTCKSVMTGSVGFACCWMCPVITVYLSIISIVLSFCVWSLFSCCSFDLVTPLSILIPKDVFSPFVPWKWFLIFMCLRKRRAKAPSKRLVGWLLSNVLLLGVYDYYWSWAFKTKLIS